MDRLPVARVACNRNSNAAKHPQETTTARCRLNSVMHELWFERDGGQLFAVETGQGPPIVMLHGGMASHVACLPLVAPLASRYRILTPDLRGSGMSWYGGPLTFDQLADDVEALLDHIGADRAVVGGVSAGSGVALRFALRFPKKSDNGARAGQACLSRRGVGLRGGSRKTFAGMDAVASRALRKGSRCCVPSMRICRSRCGRRLWRWWKGCSIRRAW